MTTSSTKPLIAILMGSDTDLPTMKAAGEAIALFETSFEIKILSAHRTPDEVSEYARTAHGRGVRVIIAGAGGAAHLPGMVAAHTLLPVIGVPVPVGHMQGEDALYSIVQMPKGVPVATVAIGNAWNAGILAVQILAAGGKEPDDQLTKKLAKYKADMRTDVLKKKV